MNVSSTTGGNFCEVTQQSNWCSSRMPCHDVDLGGLCPVQSWCVCQWAFDSYIKNAGGCEHIQNIKCEAVNRQALIAYRKSEKYKDALECIERKCGLM